jgi:hypothetical protein
MPDGTYTQGTSTYTTYGTVMLNSSDFSIVTGTGALALVSTNNVVTNGGIYTQVVATTRNIGANVVATNQRQFGLTTATTSQLGGVKPDGTTIGITNGVINVNTATASRVGGVKIGSNITLLSDGTISVETPYTLNTATTSVLGGVKIGSGINIVADGTISVTPYTLNTATNSVVGGIKVGTSLLADSTGILNTNGAQPLVKNRYAMTGTTTASIVTIYNSDTDENGTTSSNMLAYWDNKNALWKYVSNNTAVTVLMPPAFSPTDIGGCVLWCDLTSVSLGTSTWSDKSGNGNDGSIGGSPTLASTSGNGASAITTALSGGTSDYVSWIGKSLLPSDYTCFTVARYSGATKERIWGGSNQGGGSSGWFTGHHSSKAGVGYANGWVGPSGTDFYGTNWVISVQSPYYYQANGNASTLGTGGTTYITTDFGCNYKTDEASNFQTVECIIYNSTLGGTNRSTVLNYLATKYGITLGV